MSSDLSSEEEVAMRQKSVDRLLRDVLQGLEIKAESQLALNPAQIDRVEVLALAFDDIFGMAKVHCAEAFTHIQWEALRAIDRKLDAMSLGGKEFEDEIWTEDGLRSHPAWAEVRALARTALDRFGWPCESPRNRND